MALSLQLTINKGKGPRSRKQPNQYGYFFPSPRSPNIWGFPCFAYGSKMGPRRFWNSGEYSLASTPSRRQSRVSNSEKTSILADIVHSLSGQGGKEIVLRRLSLPNIQHLWNGLTLGEWKIWPLKEAVVIRPCIGRVYSRSVSIHLIWHLSSLPGTAICALCKPPRGRYIIEEIRKLD